MKKFVLFLVGFVGLQGAIFLTALSKIPAGAESVLSGYPAHFAAFFVTTFFLSGLLSHRFVNFKYPFLAAFVYSIICAAAIEYFQRWFTNYRSYDVKDMLAGVIGSAVCIALCKLMIRLWKKQPVF